MRISMYINGVLWLLAIGLVGYSWFEFGQNGLAHTVFGAIFLLLAMMDYGLCHVKRKSWYYVGMAWRVISTLLVLVILSGEYHSLFGEGLSLFD